MSLISVRLTHSKLRWLAVAFAVAVFLYFADIVGTSHVPTSPTKKGLTCTSSSQCAEGERCFASRTGGESRRMSQGEVSEVKRLGSPVPIKDERVGSHPQ